MIIIPSIDIHNGKIVRSRKSDFKSIVFYEKPILEQVNIYNDLGFEWVQVVDLQGSKTGKISIKNILKEIKNTTKLKIQFGGGVRDSESFKELLEIGIDKIIIGSLAIKEKKEFEKIVISQGPEKIVVAFDIVKDFIAVTGWTEHSHIEYNEHLDYCSSRGLETFLITDISKELNVKFFSEIKSKYPHLNFIVAGGIKNISTVEKLNELNLFGVIVGKAIYENKIDLNELVKLSG
ncbi:MAG: 1-(5-phosphoribosyl)-5-[(5-phosphoribosylamino)methylideneamino]imidazole-4-carboxamide isomerase [Chlorobiaceae bacterium]|nr:1-(5-phosphoribosyl)-5-[(5-phosphoribosylamino)methylideneamino]imidazole-4-carboxamide isomerase [Chlorobiaceae bacterium]MBA4309065.1 1-(5-phosphoribosyl)-5-[(5-phosphoribosylamino)methylideneamino]imidazole-4-carboxamide isomerase [Chlorobiaceae bacterium]